MTVRNIPLSQRRRGLRRPRNVAATDDRSPMRRLLEDGQAEKTNDGQLIAPQYERQFQTLWRAQRLGYVDDNQCLTDKGREFLASDRK